VHVCVGEVASGAGEEEGAATWNDEEVEGAGQGHATLKTYDFLEELKLPVHRQFAFRQGSTHDNLMTL
jgi:hypothetical protein